MKVISTPESIPEWPLVGRKDYDFKEQWNGNYINLYTAIRPHGTEKETSLHIEECCKTIAQWIIQNRSIFSKKDRFQIGVGGSMNSDFLGRQIAKTGGTWDDVERLANGKLIVKLYPGWSDNVFGLSSNSTKGK